MNWLKGLAACGVALAAVAALVLTGCAMQQSGIKEIHGTPRAPSATATISGEQLPAPPQKFEGKIERTAQESTPYWPARIVPPRAHRTCCSS